MRKTLTDRAVAALAKRSARYAVADPSLSGMVVRIQPSGAKAYYAITRTASSGRQVWTKIGDAKTMTIADARTRAVEIIRRVSDGLPAIEPKGETFGAVAGEWFVRHVEKGKQGKLRSADEIKRLLDRYVLPRWKDREFVSIKRTDVTSLLDEIEDNHGARTADYVLAVVRKLMRWTAARRDDYLPVVVPGMKRQSAVAQARDRILDDRELPTIWSAAGDCGTFGAFVKIALLTAQRREKVAGMRWDDVKDGVWTISRADREKETAGVLVLPDMAREIIEAQPRLASNPHIFAGNRGGGPINGFSKAKARLDRLSGVNGWTVHDVRRTARSLMSRAGVSSDHAERVMGHKIVGIEATYDRYAYVSEKSDALKRLAALIETIVKPVFPQQCRGDTQMTAY